MNTKAPLLIVAGNRAQAGRVWSVLEKEYALSIASYEEDVSVCLERYQPSVIIVIADDTGKFPDSMLLPWLVRGTPSHDVSRLLITSTFHHQHLGPHLSQCIGNFVVKPYHEEPFSMRIRELVANKSMRRTGPPDGPLEVFLTREEHWPPKMVKASSDSWSAPAARVHHSPFSEYQSHEPNRDGIDGPADDDSAVSVLNKSLKSLEKSLGGMVRAMAVAVEEMADYPLGHQSRVATLARTVGHEMGFSPGQVEDLSVAGLIHDLGMLYLPPEVLAKSGALSEAEVAMVRSHPRIGFSILQEISFPQHIAQMVHQHHERLDGSGYPSGLAGSEMARSAKVLAVAEVIEAMTSPRPYRQARTLPAALAEVSEKKGIWYSAEVVDACLRLFEAGHPLFTPGALVWPEP